ncbi:MAG: tetraacyldisaccharide 4'-kinase [Gammaproteobacteria bacterium]|nr:tetraacyldisaccharide 4'-kinase [Gammaproteobacteria bacterium]
MAQTREHFWYRRSFWRFLLWPLHLLLYVLVFARRLAYRLKIFSSYKSALPVIVVGNISVGGTGKTPFILWLADYFQQQGLTVAIVSRGYGAHSDQYPLIVTEQTLASECGDEPKLLANASGAVVVVDPNRVRAIKMIEQTLTVDIIIADDGLQHYAMARDLEICLIDGYRQFGNGLLLPFGPLREPTSRLASCDVIMQNSGEPKLPFMMTMEPLFLQNLATGERLSLDERKWPFEQYSAICGLANPVKFERTLAEFKEPAEFKAFADHYPFSATDLANYNDQPLVMTEKDAVKCSTFARKNWWFLCVRPKVNEAASQQLTQKLSGLVDTINSRQLKK